LVTLRLHHVLAPQRPNRGDGQGRIRLFREPNGVLDVVLPQHGHSWKYAPGQGVAEDVCDCFSLRHRCDNLEKD